MPNIILTSLVSWLTSLKLIANLSIVINLYSCFFFYVLILYYLISLGVIKLTTTLKSINALDSILFKYITCLNNNSKS